MFVCLSHTVYDNFGIGAKTDLCHIDLWGIVLPYNLTAVIDRVIDCSSSYFLLEKSDDFQDPFMLGWIPEVPAEIIFQKYIFG